MIKAAQCLRSRREAKEARKCGDATQITSSHVFPFSVEDTEKKTFFAFVLHRVMFQTRGRPHARRRATDVRCSRPLFSIDDPFEDSFCSSLFFFFKYQK